MSIPQLLDKSDTKNKKKGEKSHQYMCRNTQRTIKSAIFRRICGEIQL